VSKFCAKVIRDQEETDLIDLTSHRNTVLSKRKLIQLVDQKHVFGWDDPRMPTLSGMRRRGVPPAALRLFCERVGISKADSNIDYVVLEDCIREEMDKVCTRAFCVIDPLKITLNNWGESGIEDLDIARHPKIEELGDRVVPFGKNLYIERSDFFDLEGPEGATAEGIVPKDFKRLLPGQMVRLKFAYVISCDEVVRNSDTQEPVELKCTVYPETRGGVTPENMPKVKGIIHWVEASTGIKCQINQYDRLFLTEEPGKDSDDFIKDINPNSFKVIKNVIIEPSVAMDALGKLAEIRHSSDTKKVYASTLAYQFERNGYFSLDQDSGIGNLVFNRVVTLRDAWGAPPHDAKPEQRNRGGNQQPKAAENEMMEDIRRVALKVATILEAGPHPEADNLLICKVDCGDVMENGEAGEPRTVVAGLAGKIPVGELIGKKVVAITNLKPAKMRGVDSMAMLLAASDGSEDNERVELLTVPDSVPNGELIAFEGKESAEPDVVLKSKGALKVWDRVKSRLKSNGFGEATYLEDDSVYRMMTSGGPVTTITLKNAVIQ
jgi:methionine--tRNA ligase beta chain